MAVIECFECGNKISDKAQTCPSCGIPLNQSILSNKQSREASNTNSENLSVQLYIICMMFSFMMMVHMNYNRILLSIFEGYALKDKASFINLVMFMVFLAIAVTVIYAIKDKSSFAKFNFIYVAFVIMLILHLDDGIYSLTYSGYFSFMIKRHIFKFTDYLTIALVAMNIYLYQRIKSQNITDSYTYGYLVALSQIFGFGLLGGFIYGLHKQHKKAILDDDAKKMSFYSRYALTMSSCTIMVIGFMLINIYHLFFRNNYY